MLDSLCCKPMTTWAAPPAQSAMSSCFPDSTMATHKQMLTSPQRTHATMQPAEEQVTDCDTVCRSAAAAPGQELRRATTYQKPDLREIADIAAPATGDKQHTLLHCLQLDGQRNTHSHPFQRPGQTVADLSAEHPSVQLMCDRQVTDKRKLISLWRKRSSACINNLC